MEAGWGGLWFLNSIQHNFTATGTNDGVQPLEKVEFIVVMLSGKELQEACEEAETEEVEREIIRDITLENLI